VFDYLLDNMSEGVVRDGVARAREIGLQEEPSVAGKTLGTGYEVLAEDTVPFCIWIVARHPDNYEDALWSTVSALGDRDTTCAIVGSIVAISAGENSIPSAWLIAREPLSVMQ